MSKIKRRVTVDSAKSVPDEGDRRKPSVFERLGPGARKQLDDVKMITIFSHSMIDIIRISNFISSSCC